MTIARLIAIVAVLLAGAATVTGAWFFAPWLGRDTPKMVPKKDASAPPPARAEAKQEKAKETADLGFDVVRIGPNEPSVFAGRAPPESAVSITANGKPITTAKANEDGEWVALPDAKFRPGDYDITLEAKVARPGLGTETTSRSYKVAVAGAAGPSTDAAPAAERVSAPREPPRPRPITFVYNEAAFAREGEAAAAALAEYVRFKRFDFLELSGHADERGSREHNVALSRRRAEAVAEYLRRSGYGGELNLIAAGETEPYAEVDRRAVPQDSLYQYDRRVELRAAR